MKTKYAITIVVTGLLMITPVQATAPLGSADNDPFYYQIGGATSITAPPFTGTRMTVLDASLDLGLGYSCGKFDPMAGLKSSVEKVSHITDTLAMAVQGAISALPMLILQRVNPGLYDLLQNLIIKGEAVLALANTSCEQMEQEIKKGNNPYEAWTDLSKMIDWKIEMNTSGSAKTDVTSAKHNVETNNGKNGVPWVGGNRAGGDGQRQIRMTHDVVKAGYNLNLNRAVTLDTTYSHTGSADTLPRLAEIWREPTMAADWAVSVLGDVMVSTYDSHTDQSTPGMGLLPKIQSDKDEVNAKLNALVKGGQPATLANLREVSSNEVLLTQAVIKALADLPPTDQAIASGKLASEVAMSRNLEKAIYLRRLLLSGKREPNVVKTAASLHIDDAIKELDRAVDDILFEKRVHQELVSQTAVQLLELRHQHQNRGKAQQPEAAYDVRPVVDGAVK